MTVTDQLTDREREILRTVIHCFIASAIPVASEHLARNFFSNLSPATIRNVLADLEEKGYINHPHTSAGRVPTDMGYRVYVDTLMEMSQLSSAQRRAIRQMVLAAPDAEEVLKETSKILGRISQQLSIVSFPHLSTGVLERIELVPVSASRVLVVMTMKSSLVKTITMEVSSEIPREKLENVARLLNERIAGLTLLEIRETFAERVRDVNDEGTGLIRLFVYASDRLFDDVREREKVFISGTPNILQQPEFSKPEQYRDIIELLDDEETIVHVLDGYGDEIDPHRVTVKIGSENKHKKLRNYALVLSTYSIGDVAGTIGIIGPKRMNYAKAVPLVSFAAETISSTWS